VLDHIPLLEPSTVPHIITMFEGKIAIYLGLDSGARRAFWDPVTKKLSLDESWVVSPMQQGQSTADAPSLLGDWIVLQLNGIGSKTVASSIVAVHRETKRMKVVSLRSGPVNGASLIKAGPIRAQSTRRHGDEGGRHQNRPGHRRDEGGLRRR
jgi:hypothetical protein